MYVTQALPEGGFLAVSATQSRKDKNSLNMEGKLLWTCEIDKAVNKATDYLENKKMVQRI